uniref:TIGR00255 family protein n=1 Tax=Candidatus Kentrum sp. DK TaxID=2126562 RepID=A0A450SSB6_9GAMM|nr:MAG: TIGR00255 family protein [Candidatus Kentron sp. DK]
MIYSMTAFARQQAQTDWGDSTWELRSVNHRYLDVSIRLPEDLRSLENAVRERLRNRLDRGKVECLLRYRPVNRQDAALRIDMALAEQVVAAAERIAGLLPGEGRIDPLRILQWPGVVEAVVPDVDAAAAPILDALDRAIAELVAMRAGEGEKLAALIMARCREMSTIVAGVRERLPSILAAQRTGIVDRLSELQAELDPARLEQELVLFAQKIDVAEELDRLDTHLAEVTRLFGEDAAPGKTPPGKRPMGRRLDFLMQELHREANTLSAKSVDKEVTSASVELRVLIEQMREQVQNIE